MKKLFVLFVLVLAVAFSGCASDNSNPEKTPRLPTPTPESTATQESTSTPEPTATPEQTPTQESTATPEPTPTPTPIPVQDILTIENCPEFAAVMAVQYPVNPLIKAFADKYKGRIIAFDGNIDSVSENEDDNTRHDILIYAGDYSNINITGPSFYVTNVTIDDLNFVGENIPDHIDSGLDIHIIAEIGTCDAADNIELHPISIEVR